MAYDAPLVNYFTPYNFETHKFLARCDGLHDSQPVRVLRTSPHGYRLGLYSPNYDQYYG